MANTRITRSISSGSTTNKFTLSFWIKKSTISGSSDMWLFEKYNNGSARTWIRFNTDTGSPRLEVSEYTGTYVFRKILNRVFRDVGAYYHIHIEFNSTLGTEADRLKIYINGVQETSFATTNHPALNSTSIIANAGNQHFGYSENGNGNYFSGIMSHINFTDGYAYAPTSFGEYDANGVWKIKTSPSVTYGTNGFFILKNGNSVTDQSGNSNNFTVGGGTLTNTEDCPSNVFATLNPLVNNAGEMMRLTNGNTSCQSNATEGNSWKLAVSTLGMTSGKYYWEIKFDNVHNCYNNGVMGSNVLTLNAQNPMNQTGYTGFYNQDGGEFRKDNTDTTVDYGLYNTGDIMGIACDMDNYTITFYKNGVSHVSSQSISTTGRDVVFPCSVFYNTNNTGIPQASYNFGNGYFGTTAVSSAGTNASGNGIFEYDVPTGYTALSTKGLNL